MHFKLHTIKKYAPDADKHSGCMPYLFVIDAVLCMDKGRVPLVIKHSLT